MKKISAVLFTSLIAISSCTLAHNNNQTGYVYLAADAGIFSADFNNTYLDQTDTIPQNFQSTVTQHGYTGGLAIGYRKPIYTNYFIGGEISGNVDSSNALFQEGASSGNFSDKTRINDHMDFTFVPGLKLSNTVSAFLKLGLSLAWIQDNLTSPVYPAGLYTPVMTYYTNSNTEIGFTAGLGLSKSVCKHAALFTEADYHDYGTMNFQNFQNYSATYTHSTHVYSYDVVVGAAYRFV
jgi:opacity protein-like surface antigen